MRLQHRESSKQSSTQNSPPLVPSCTTRRSSPRGAPQKSQLGFRRGEGGLGSAAARGRGWVNDDRNSARFTPEVAVLRFKLTALMLQR